MYVSNVTVKGWALRRQSSCNEEYEGPQTVYACTVVSQKRGPDVYPKEIGVPYSSLSCI